MPKNSFWRFSSEFPRLRAMFIASSYILDFYIVHHAIIMFLNYLGRICARFVQSLYDVISILLIIASGYHLEFLSSRNACNLCFYCILAQKHILSINMSFEVSDVEECLFDPYPWTNVCLIFLLWTSVLLNIGI